MNNKTDPMGRVIADYWKKKKADMEHSIIDKYLEKSYWIIDILPRQVLANAQGQYFKIEDYFLEKPQVSMICEKFCRVLLKLNCYYDISVYNALNEWSDNPQPASIEKWLLSGDSVYVVMKTEDAMIGFNGDDLYMTLYNANGNLLELVRSLAISEGLFVWKPDNQD